MRYNTYEVIAARLHEVTSYIEEETFTSQEKTDPHEEAARFKSQYIQPKDIQQFIGLCRSTAEKMERLGLFPARVVLSRGPEGRAGKTAWLLSDILEWQRRRIREGKQAPALVPINMRGRL